MRLYEFEAKQIFKSFGISIPKQIATIQSIDEIDTLNCKFPVMIKAMVLIGGRGKSGGIKKANNIEDLKEKTSAIFNLQIEGYPVKKILIEEAVEVLNEIYLSVTTDPATFDVVIVTSASGGVDIESVANTNPEAIFTRKITNNSRELSQEVKYEAVKFLISQNIQLTEVETELQDVIGSIFHAFQEMEAKICEINPLIMTISDGKGVLLGADAKIVLDDNSLYRQAPLLKSIGIDPKSKRHDVSEQTIFEARGFKAGFQYLDLLGNPENFVKNHNKLYIGLVPGGAGYGIFSIDEVVNIGKRFFENKVIPINFMDSGGGPALGTVAEMFHLLMDHPATDLIITSRFGGISSCDIFIQGLVMALRDRYLSGKKMIPVFGRMVGTDLAAAVAFLEKAKRDTPKPLKDMNIIVGNQKIMADVIRDAIEYGFKVKENGAN
ncbi:MAG: Succinyl-CoA ligase [ADP-forming] subunit beta [Candidatus Heimdallarchaeota archaeon LC_2]|nr:MAG: Succinyl-CoA ligase [ADP-forming] subunit beta [Candidatus Heimdallarchaeota archaeon LC_2]